MRQLFNDVLERMPFSLAAVGKLCSDHLLQGIDKEDCNKSHPVLRYLYPNVPDDVDFTASWWYQRPAGCFFDLKTMELHWNLNTTGSANTDDRPVCEPETKGGKNTHSNECDLFVDQ